MKSRVPPPLAMGKTTREKDFQATHDMNINKNDYESQLFPFCLFFAYFFDVSGETCNMKMKYFKVA